MSEQQRVQNGIVTLPKSLAEALDCLEADGKLMPGGIKMPYLMHKRGELSQLAGIEGDEVFARYAQVY
jgi:glutamine synthetase